MPVESKPEEAGFPWAEPSDSDAQLIPEEGAPRCRTGQDGFRPGCLYEQILDNPTGSPRVKATHWRSPTVPLGRNA